MWCGEASGVDPGSVGSIMDDHRIMLDGDEMSVRGDDGVRRVYRARLYARS